MTQRILDPIAIVAAAEHLVAQALHAGYRLEISLQPVDPPSQYRTRHQIKLHPIVGPEGRATAYDETNESAAIQHYLAGLRQ